MSAAILLEYLESKGVVLSVINNSLQLKAPPGVITSELKQNIGASKIELITVLQERQHSLTQTQSNGVPQSPKSISDKEQVQTQAREAKAAKQQSTLPFKKYLLPNGTYLELTKEDFDNVVNFFAGMRNQRNFLNKGES